MPVTVEQIEEWRAANSETERLEFKEASIQYDNTKLFEYCVAIANEGGGHLLLGIKNALPRPVVGTRAFNNPGVIARKIFEKLQFRVEVEEVLHPHGRVVVFTIPSRPKGAPCHLEGRYLMRCGESLLPMSTDQIRKICDEGKPDWLDEHVAEKLECDEVLELLDTRTFFSLLKIEYPTNANGVIERLKQELLIDEANGFSVRRIAAILLAKRMNSFPELSGKIPRVIVYDGTSKNKEKLHQDGKKGYALGFGGLIRFVEEQMPQHEVIEDGFRNHHSLVPDLVVRELMANALIHQDFTVSGKAVMVEIYSDRIEISNPGSPAVPVERFADENRSRNERLALMMRRVGICEEKGSGIDKVLSFAEALGLPAPFFRGDSLGTKVTVYGPKEFEDLNSEERVRACYWHCALKWVRSERMTNHSLRDRFKLSEKKSATVSQVISASIARNRIKRDATAGESHKYAKYVPFWA